MHHCFHQKYYNIINIDINYKKSFFSTKSAYWNDTEDWSNDAENVLIIFPSIAVYIQSALVHIRDFF